MMMISIHPAKSVFYFMNLSAVLCYHSSA